MRISDWSSDACSSDLPAEADRRVTALAVINCAAEGVAGHVSGVEVQKWVDIFFVEPSIARDRTDTDEIYVEVIGLTTTAGGNQQAQLIRREDRKSTRLNSSH